MSLKVLLLTKFFWDFLTSEALFQGGPRSSKNDVFASCNDLWMSLWDNARFLQTKRRLRTFETKETDYVPTTISTRPRVSRYFYVLTNDCHKIMIQIIFFSRTFCILLFSRIRKRNSNEETKWTGHYQVFCEM